MKGYIFHLFLLMLFGLPIYAFVRILLLRRRARRLGAKKGIKKEKLKFNKLREVCLGLFVVFMMALLVFVFQGEYSSPVKMLASAKHRLATREGINLRPFRTVQNYYKVFGPQGDLFAINILGNILMFLPWGFGLLFLWKKNRSFFRLLYFSAILPIFIEFSQLFINRQVDIDDFVLNFLGGMLGGLIYFLLAGLFPKCRKAAL